MEALLIFLGIIVLVHWFEYRRSIQEYSVTQVPTTEIASVMSEKTPIMVDIGPLPWRPEIAQTASYPIEDNEGLAAQIDLAKGLIDLDSARSLWWLPGVFYPSVDIMKHEVAGLTWVTAERQWIGCTSGSLIIWLVHSRYRQFLPSSVVDPWTLTVAEAPYIGRVQFIEVVIKPGWALGLPSHWGYAVKAEEAWSWTAEQHSIVSLGVTQMPGVLMDLKSKVQDLRYTEEHVDANPTQ
jgi:hypothetical protein